MYCLTGVPGFLKRALPESINIVGRSLELCDRYLKISSPATPSVHYWLLRPAVESVRWYEFHRVRECIQAGEAVGRQVAGQINDLLKQGILPEEPEIKLAGKEK